MADLIVKPNHAVSTEVFGDYDRSSDFHGVDQHDLIIPRLKLGQAMDKNVQDAANKLSVGDFYDSSTKTPVFKAGTTGKIVVIAQYKEWIEYNPDKTKKGKDIILNRSTDPNTTLGRQLMAEAQAFVEIMTLKGPAFKVTEIYNYLVLVPEYTNDFTTMYLLSFYRAAHKHGKMFLNKLMRNVWKDPENPEAIVRDPPIFSSMWDIRSDVALNGAGEPYMVPVVGVGTPLSRDYFPSLRAISTSAKERLGKIKAANVGEEPDAVDATVDREPSQL